MSRRSEAIAQIDFTRRYNLERIDSVPLGEWFTVPPGGVSHIAWQVGHMAMAEYRLCLERSRPRTPADESLIPDAFLKVFARESLPESATGFTAEEIHAIFDRVHAASSGGTAELPGRGPRPTGIEAAPAVHHTYRKPPLRPAARDDSLWATRDDPPNARPQANLVNLNRPAHIL